MADKEDETTPDQVEEVATEGADDVKARFRAALDAKHAAAHPDADGARKGGSGGPHATSGAHTRRVFRRKSGG